MVNEARQAGAPNEAKNEIEITPEMIEAGEYTYCETEFDAQSLSAIRDMIKSIYLAMAAVDPQR